MMSETNIL